MNTNLFTNREKDIVFQKTIEDILKNDKVKEMNNFMQHYDTTCFEHCYNASYICYLVCKKLHLDYISAARGAMLHDLFLYDWRKRQNGRKGLHAYTHGKTAYLNASSLFKLNKIEKNMILRHMFPVTPIPPIYPEGIILTFVDKYCAILEMVLYIKKKHHLKHIEFKA